MCDFIALRISILFIRIEFVTAAVLLRSAAYQPKTTLWLSVYTVLSVNLWPWFDRSVSTCDTAILASLVTISLIPVSFTVGRELLKYLRRAILSRSVLRCKTLNSTGVIFKMRTLRGWGNIFVWLNKLLFNLIATGIYHIIKHHPYSYVGSSHL